jgi:hypothetical protein
MYVCDVVAVGDVSKVIKQAAVVVTMTSLTCVANALLVAALDVEADMLCVTPGLKTLLFTLFIILPIGWSGQF